MKSLIAALLFANAAFFAYAHFIGEPARRAVAADTPAPIPRLKLASEAGDLPARRCVSVGPFTEQAVAERAVLYLRSDRREPRLRTTQMDAAATYAVRLETPTLQQAARIAIRLRAAGVADVDVVPPETGATRASLAFGTYTQRERADARVAELRPYGVNPAITEQARSTTNWWIDVDRHDGDKPIDVAALQTAVPGTAGLATETCPDVGPPPAPARPALPVPGSPAGEPAGPAALG